MLFVQPWGGCAITEEEIFRTESRGKKICYVHVNQAIVASSDHVFRIDLGTCVCVILCGIDDRMKVWFGVNHLFKSRVENKDMALTHISRLYNSLSEKKAGTIRCLGLFGAGYREKSLAKGLAQMNVLSVLEALSLYNLNIEIFQTGYSQCITVLKSDQRDSFFIKHNIIGDKKSRIIELPLVQIFGIDYDNHR